MLDYKTELFIKKVHDSLDTVQRILDLHRHPRLAEDVDHDYSDKYRLVEQMANTALIAQFNVLTYFGLTKEILQSIDQSKPTTLRFQASTSCTFLKEEIVEVPSPKIEEIEEHVESSLLGSTNRSTIKQVVHQVTEYHWKVDVEWEVSLYSGSDVQGRTTLKRRSSSMVLIIQSNKQSPLRKHKEYNPVDLSLSLLLECVNTNKMVSTFAIDRDAPATKTPCQNEQVASVLKSMNQLEEWTNEVRNFFVVNVLKEYQHKHNPAGSAPALGCQGNTWSLPGDEDILFVPILPVMETTQTLQTANAGTSLDDFSTSVLALAGPTVTEALSSPSTQILSMHDMHTLLNEQVRSIEERIATLHKMYPSSESTTAWSVEEVTLVVLCPYSRTIGERFVDAVNYIESMLRNQLVAAIGKHIQLSDIEQYVHYHNARLLNSPPKSFCHPIRLLGHDPYGLLSIESTNADGTRKPIQTLCREIMKSSNSSTVMVPLNSAATVELSGQMYLHGWINHRFGQSTGSFDLIARARQFSAFLLVVGTMSGSDQLEPKDAIIVQNKDEVLIPLLLDEIPTSKEFKDAIHSLSPEQQRFAKAFRSMQLASSVLGICVIQIKPQLEVLLGLGEGALTKEMQLTQDLMELFIKYQIPSDLVSYDGNDLGASRNERVLNVRGHVKSVFDVIHATKGKEIQEKLTEGLAKHLDLQVEASGPRHPYGVYPAMQVAPPKQTRVRRAKKMICGSVSLSMRGVSNETRAEALEVDHDPTPSSTESNFHMPHSTSAHPEKYDNTQQEMSNVLQSNDFNASTIPQLLNSAIEATSLNIALRSTTIKLNNQWRRNRQADLLSKPVPSTLDALDGSIKTETNKAFDLLDALTRSGSLSIAFSEVHVLVAVTHSFEKDVIETIVQDNINPIEKLEMSTLLVGSVIHDVPVSNLVRDEGALARWTNFV